MKIVSKRGRQAQVDVVEIHTGYHGVIIIDGGTMSQEEIRRAEEAMEELRRQLDDLQDLLDTGWYNLRKD